MQQDDIVKGIGAKVRAARTAKGMSRKVLAASADVSERYLHQLETGTANASVGILLRVAAALDLDIVTLVSNPMAVCGMKAPAHGMHPPLAALLAASSLAEQQAALPVLAAFLEGRRRSRNGIALLGLRGAGKSTLGRLLAARHAMPFVSVTQEIEQRAGMTLNDLFNLGGAEAYRSLENEVVAALAQREDRIVLETAGGIAVNVAALDIVLGAFHTVWIKAAPEEHLTRVAGQGDIRPMQGNPKALEHLKSLLAQREPAYARAASILDTTARTQKECIAELERIVAPILTQRAD